MHTPRIRRTAGTIVLGLILGGCVTTGQVPQTAARPDPLPTTRSPSPGPATPAPDAVLEQPGVRAAIAAEAQRRGVRPAAVKVVTYAEVTWPDGSIGCPQPGVSYTQALVPGRLLVMQVDGEPASYHAGRSDEFRHCPRPSPPLGPDADR